LTAEVDCPEAPRIKTTSNLTNRINYLMNLTLSEQQIEELVMNGATNYEVVTSLDHCGLQMSRSLKI